MCQDLLTNISEYFVVYCDNKFSICIARNPTFDERMKHIEIDFHFVQTKLQEGPILVSSSNKVAVMLTELLHPRLFCDNLSKVNMKDIHA